jgi:hypothetical protein
MEGRWWRSRPMYIYVTSKSVDSEALRARHAIDKSLGLSVPPSLSRPISPSPLSPCPRTIEPNRTNEISCGAKVLESHRHSSVQFWKREGPALQQGPVPARYNLPAWCFENMDQAGCTTCWESPRQLQLGRRISSRRLLHLNLSFVSS